MREVVVVMRTRTRRKRRLGRKLTLLIVLVLRRGSEVQAAGAGMIGGEVVKSKTNSKISRKPAMSGLLFFWRIFLMNIGIGLSMGMVLDIVLAQVLALILGLVLGEFITV